MHRVCWRRYTVRVHNDDDANAWVSEVRQRLRAMREHLGLSFAQAAAGSGIHGSTIEKIESGDLGLYLHQVAALVYRYGFPIDAALSGWPDGEPPPLDPAPARIRPETIDRRVRSNIRSARGRRGTPAVAADAGMNQSTLVRWESGAYRMIPLNRLHRLAGVLGFPVVQLVLGRIPQEQHP